HLGDICTVLTFGGYLYHPDIWGISVPSCHLGGYLYRPDIWGISVLSSIWGISVLSCHLGDICTVLT
ncbi:unnamed protein product, partial [Staurois parvus]